MVVVVLISRFDGDVVVVIVMLKRTCNDGFMGGGYGSDGGSNSGDRDTSAATGYKGTCSGAEVVVVARYK